jgi:phage shock protein PspC (stress-responsive transcriptional regulator)
MQRISVTARLNRSTLQFEDQAYEHLLAYLAEARRTLDGNPDQDEILTDLEQAVADQCTRRLAGGQTVVTLAELQPALDEIGSVQVPGAGHAAAGGAPSQAAYSSSRPLQQVSEDAIIGGVCTGIARYLGINPWLVRIAALLLLFATSGVVIPVYLVLMLLLPYAPRTGGPAQVRWLPGKVREWNESLRARMSATPN